MEEVVEYTEACPYCGQANLTGEDARLWCGCFQAVKYRKILKALIAVGMEETPFEKIDEELMVAMTAITHQICKNRIESVNLKLSDGTTVKIGTNVVRTNKIEQKVKI